MLKHSLCFPFPQCNLFEELQLPQQLEPQTEPGMERNLLASWLQQKKTVSI